MLKTWELGEFVRCSSFSTKNGAEESFLSINMEPDIPFPESLERLYQTYMTTLKECGLSADTQVFSRYFLSDIANQKTQLGQSEILNFSRNGAYSVIQQCPLKGGSISLFVYHIKGGKDFLGKKLMKFDDEHWRNGVKIKGEHYELFWTANFSGYGSLDSFEQTNEIFSAYNALINDNGMTLLRNTLRTWIYVRDVDNNYQGMADSRRSYFYEQGLTKDSRYIASTGIEAKLKEVYSLVSMDALSMSNLKKEQIIRMEALDNLCPTDNYGITFERGTKIEFGDRSHLFISGTASIDKKGQVLYPADVRKQTRRTLENIEALLQSHGASLNDMVYLIVYIRNITEVNKVTEILKEYISQRIPIIIVQGSVCRPKWLVEIEGIAIIPGSSAFPPFF